MSKSKAFSVSSGSDSLKATIPIAVVKALKIGHGDVLNWEIEVRDGKIIALVEKAST